MQLAKDKYLFNRELFPSYLSHLGNDLNVLFQPHLQTLSKGESGLRLNHYTQIIRQLLPMPEEQKKLDYGYSSYGALQ